MVNTPFGRRGVLILCGATQKWWCHVINQQTGLPCLSAEQSGRGSRKDLNYFCTWVPHQLQMLLFPNALCCSLYERNCVCAVTKIFTKLLPANNFCQLLRVTRKRSCTSAGNAQAQLHFRDDQQGRLELATSPIEPILRKKKKMFVFYVINPLDRKRT